MGPHQGGPVETRGVPVEEAAGAVLMVHGRNARPSSILSLADALDERFAYLAPAAAGGTWYPYGFMTETAQNEPGISSGLQALDDVVSHLVARGIPRYRIVLLGFSQGACLASTYAVKNAHHFGGVIVYSGGLIGPAGTKWEHEGDFAGTPVFLGCSDVDGHIPLSRVDETEAVFQRMGAEVTKRIYPGMGHLVNEDEIAFTRALLDQLAG